MHTYCTRDNSRVSVDIQDRQLDHEHLLYVVTKQTGCLYRMQKAEEILLHG